MNYNNERFNELNKVTIKTIILNFILVVLKLVAGIIGNSMSIIADGLHSLSDILSSIGVLIGNFVSKKPSDNGHNYGHEKAEVLTSFVLSIILIFASIEIGIKALNNFKDLNSITVPTILPLIVALISIVINEYQFYITMKVAKKQNSGLLKADAWHHRTDSLSSVAVFIGILGAMLGFKILEPIACLLVSMIVAKVGFDILKTSSNELMDCSIEEKELDNIKDKINEVNEVIELMDIKTRKHGSMIYIDTTITVNKDLSVYEGHTIAHKVEENLLNSFNNIKGITVHYEPAE